MKKNLAGLFAVLAMVIMAGTAAQADTDYRCLSMCINNGNPAASCRQECTYNLKPSAPKPQTLATIYQTPSNHNVFNAPKPVGNTVVVAPKTAPQTPQKDYACVAACMKNGWQYDMCNQNCVKPVCKSTSAMCTSSGTKTLAPAAAAMQSSNGTAPPQ